MELQQTTSDLVSPFFHKILNLSPKQSKKTYLFQLKLKFQTKEEEPKLFTETEGQQEIKRVIEKNLGKIGLAKYSFRVVQVVPFDREMDVQIKGISVNDFCIFWATLAFASRVKIELKEGSFVENDE